MRTLAVLVVISLFACTDFAEARRGGFLSALFRGGARAATHSGSSNSAVQAYSTKTYGPDVLTVAQIEDCIGRAQSLDSSAESLAATSEQDEADSRSIDEAQSDLRLQRSAVNTYSQASVDVYNAKLDSMRVRITKYNASLEIAKMEQFAHNIGVQAYNRQGTKKYYQDDVDSAKKKLGLKDEAPGLR